MPLTLAGVNWSMTTRPSLDKGTRLDLVGGVHSPSCPTVSSSESVSSVVEARESNLTMLREELVGELNDALSISVSGSHVRFDSSPGRLQNSSGMSALPDRANLDRGGRRATTAWLSVVKLDESTGAWAAVVKDAILDDEACA
eukprot:scaffold34651_cov152-Isochrysis_galbana.AAC.2